MTLYHYTCEHGHAALSRAPLLLPSRVHSPRAADRIPRDLAWMLDVVWMTDLDEPMPESTGLTSRGIVCDRTAHRWRVVDEQNVELWVRWLRAHRVQPAVVEALHSGPHALPMHWYVSELPVPVVLDEWAAS